MGDGFGWRFGVGGVGFKRGIGVIWGGDKGGRVRRVKGRGKRTRWAETVGFRWKGLPFGERVRERERFYGGESV